MEGAGEDGDASEEKGTIEEEEGTKEKVQLSSLGIPRS